MAKPRRVILLADDEVIVRLGLARHLRGCGFDVIEASGAADAKIVLQRGPSIDILFADARLAGPDSGFALAQWTRRYRKHIEIILTGSLAHKSEAAAQLCGQGPNDAERLLRGLHLKRRRSAGATVGTRKISNA